MMPVNCPKTIFTLLTDPSGELQLLIAHAEHVQQAQQLLCIYLDKPLNQHCQVTNIKKNTIVINVSSSAWAAKLRFHVAAILTNLKKNQNLGMLQSIRIKVKPSDEPIAPVLTERPVVSEYAAKVINAAAQATLDHELKKILLRLAQRRIIG